MTSYQAPSKFIKQESHQNKKNELPLATLIKSHQPNPTALPNKISDKMYKIRKS